ncbi:hypothetical protein G647_02981 [Cladophialophora carrionii CBS 160.54]|uniref:Uncharacterized protein n=1 Tax=Cladophialophora carrionii CBS 160.54 TaxID=1279043 RepID=V9DH32_9EURO|nr:uncharacterized protein G647_02981 [Cladophialophora carrionii CBS 160.54]ETI26204.1 hypothetical protein G647_02981 [Cladophialophora carrionii CBS 160.54]
MTNNRNRAGRRGNDSRGANSNLHRQSTSASAVSRDGTNANQNRRGGKGPSNLSKSTDNVRNGPNAPATSLPPPDDHIPMAGFNAGAVEAMLKQGYEPKTSLYKPDAKSQAPSPSSPWGAKPGSMANGKDFWLDLRRQVAALQQTGGVSQGG